MDADSENEPRKETHRLRIVPWLTGLFIAIALYVLSIGPVLRFFSSPGTDIVTFYAPLGGLCDKSETTERFFDWYIGLWAR